MCFNLWRIINYVIRSAKDVFFVCQIYTEIKISVLSTIRRILIFSSGDTNDQNQMKGWTTNLSVPQFYLQYFVVGKEI